MKVPERIIDVGAVAEGRQVRLLFATCRLPVLLTLLPWTLLLAWGCAEGKEGQPDIIGIEIKPSMFTIHVGASRQMQVQGLLTGGGTFDMTDSVTWGSSRTQVATISTTSLTRAFRVGTSSISATFQDLSSSATLNVTTSSCVDKDSDGHGAGSTCLGPDCNDSDADIWKAGQTTIRGFKLDSKASALSTSPGQKIGVAYRYVVTASKACPGCAVQLVTGLYRSTLHHHSRQCVDLKVLKKCPGKNSGAPSFSMIAPRLLGTYSLRLRRIEKTGCTAARKDFDINSGPHSLGQLTVKKPPCLPGQWYVRSARINGHQGTVTVQRGATVSALVDYFLAQSKSCPACLYQVVVGLGRSAVDCKHLGYVRGCHGGGTQGTVSTSFKVPHTPGTYRLTFSRVLHYDCPKATAYFNSKPPGDEATVGVVIVK